MARQRISFVEKHIEKGVVAVLGGVLAWVVMVYLIKSPNTIPLKGQDVDPSRIDGFVRKTAEEVWGRVQNAAPEATATPDYPQQQVELSAGPLHRPDLGLNPDLTAGVPFGLPVPEVQGPGARGQVTLAKLIAPHRPVLKSGRYSTYLPPGESTPLCEELSDKNWNLMNAEKEKDVCWVTAAVRFSVDGQKKVFLANDYETSRLTVEATAVLLQRQRESPGGGWGDWEDVRPYKVHVMPPPPPLELVDDESGTRTIPLEQRKVFFEWLAKVRQCAVQLIRPQMPNEVTLGDPWAPPLCADLARLYLDEGFICPVAPSTDAGRRLNPKRQAELDLETARHLLDQDRLDEATELVQKVLTNKTLPRKAREDAEQLESQILKRQGELEREAILAEEQAEGGEAAGDEAPQRREEIYLAHDLGAEPGARYRYRAGLQAYNQYAAVPDRLQSVDEAAQVFISSEWSEPSDPVDVPPLKRVFLTKAEPDRGSARFDVYVWTRGGWVKDNVAVKIGESIGKKEKVQHYGLGDKIDVEFDTGLVVLDVLPETERSYVAVKHDSDGGILAADPVKTNAVLCAAADRRIVEFLEEADKDSPDRRHIEDEIDDAKRKAQPPKSGRP